MLKQIHPDLRALTLGAALSLLVTAGYAITTGIGGPDLARRAAMGAALGVLAAPALVLPGRPVDRMWATGWALRFAITITLAAMLAASPTRFVATPLLVLPTLLAMAVSGGLGAFGLWPRPGNDAAQATWFDRWYLAHRVAGWQRTLTLMVMPLTYVGFLLLLLTKSEADISWAVFVGAVAGLSPMQVRRRDGGDFALGAGLTIVASLVLALTATI